MKNDHCYIIAIHLLFVITVTPVSCQTPAPTGANVDTAQILKNGDVLFQDSHSSQSEDIKAMTHSPFCHVGVYFKEDGIDYVYHAGSPVQRVTFEEWIGHGKGFGDVRRIRSSGLTGAEVNRLRTSLRRHLRKEYDALFRPNHEKLYCSEYVFLAYQEAGFGEIGQWQKFSEFALTPEVRKKLEDRYKKEHLQFHDETPVITPEALRHGKLVPAQ